MGKNLNKEIVLYHAFAIFTQMSNNFLSGKLINQGYYKAFIPNEINRKWEINDMDVITLLSQADRHLGRLDMYSEYVNIDLYISMHIAKRPRNLLE